LGANATVTVPVAVPAAPVWTVIQLLSEGVAVQAQPLGAVTTKVADWKLYVIADEGSSV
jgi:hypothetical protein